MIREANGMRCFCTYFDHRYVSQGLAMFESLNRHCHNFKLWILCLDPEVYRQLDDLEIPNVELISLQEFERDDEMLAKAKSNRSLLEYYFTCTPSLPLFILRREPTVNLITYLDSDLFFFSSIEPLFDELGDKSVGIIAHRFTEAFRKWEWNGIYNVGWVTFRRDNNGLSCLQWWRDQCIEWCYDRTEGNRFADQKYLDDWPTRFQNVVVLQHKGANLAPWNVGNYKLTLCDGIIFVDDQPLLFFHFHAFKQLAGWMFDTHLAKYKVIPSTILVRNIFGPYVRELISRSKRPGPLRAVPLRSTGKNRDSLWRKFARILKRQYLVVINGRVV